MHRSVVSLGDGPFMAHVLLNARWDGMTITHTINPAGSLSFCGIEHAQREEATRGRTEEACDTVSFRMWSRNAARSQSTGDPNGSKNA